ncbi:unnamed protein product, partial [Ectocarpus sp. 6 AP-2014]
RALWAWCVRSLGLCTSREFECAPRPPRCDDPPSGLTRRHGAALCQTQAEGSGSGCSCRRRRSSSGSSSSRPSEWYRAAPTGPRRCQSRRRGLRRGIGGGGCPRLAVSKPAPLRDDRE